MGKKIFVSYKYADSNVYPLYPYPQQTTVRSYVDQLEWYFDSTNDIYKGESNDDDLSYLSDDAIWNRLKDRIYDSSVTIVMISPNMKEPRRHDRSQWIPWEISYSLKEMTRNDHVSRSNAIFAIVLPDRNGSYEYFIKDNYCTNCSCRTLMTDTLFSILGENMFNQIQKTPKNCQYGSSIYIGEYSYILAVKWADFIAVPQSYIDRADRIKQNIQSYNITKVV